VKFNKKPTSLEEQVALLKTRGVTIDNDSATQVLLRVNYYRFCGYGLYFDEFDGDGNRLDKFLPGTSFNRILGLYLWDEKLRVLLQKYLVWEMVKGLWRFKIPVACKKSSICAKGSA
jgi:abortive infection bacteriophage resistance protein